MKAFAYVNAANQKDALAALATTTSRGKVLPIAGGMDLLGLMKDYIAQPDVLVNVKRLSSAIAVEAQGLSVIGAATSATRADAPIVVSPWAVTAIVDGRPFTFTSVSGCAM